MLGIQPELIDEKGKVVQGPDANGALCMKTPWPGMARTVFGDHQRFIDTYFSMYPGYYFTGDGGHRDTAGYWQITGRMDDVINVTGHRLGTAEVEDAIVRYKKWTKNYMPIFYFYSLLLSLGRPPSRGGGCRGGISPSGEG